MVSILFLIQIFSTLAYSVLFSTLVLYATKSLGFTSSLAVSVMGSFVAFNYFLHVVGGALTGKLFSHRFLFFLGMICQALGAALIGMGSFYWGLSLFLTGSGVNVTCINCMVSERYEANDKRRESAFLWNYSGMNVGFLIGFTISGFFQKDLNYTPLFLLAAASNVITILILFIGWRGLVDRNTSFITAKNKFQLRILGFGIMIALFLALRILIGNSHLSSILVPIFGALMWLYVVYCAIREKDKEATQKLWAFLILAIVSLVFWTLYMMAPMGLTIFIEDNVHRTFGTFTIQPQWVLNINTIVIIFGGPTMAHLYKILRRRGFKISLPFQFSMSLFLIGIGFLVLPAGIYFANPKGYTAFWWIVLSYIFQSIGELFISPIGYAMVGQLVPQKKQGMMMGVWLMNTGVSATLASFFSKMAIGKHVGTNPLLTNATFTKTFFILSVGSIIVGIIMVFLKRFLNRLIKEEAHFAEAPAEPI